MFLGGLLIKKKYLCFQVVSVLWHMASKFCDFLWLLIQTIQLSDITFSQIIIYKNSSVPLEIYVKGIFCKLSDIRFSPDYHLQKSPCALENLCERYLLYLIPRLHSIFLIFLLYLFLYFIFKILYFGIFILGLYLRKYWYLLCSRSF